MTWQPPLLKSLKLECRCKTGTQHCTSMAVCTDVRKQLHTLPFHPTLGVPQTSSWGMLTNRRLAVLAENISHVQNEGKLSFHPISCNRVCLFVLQNLIINFTVINSSDSVRWLILQWDKIQSTLLLSLFSCIIHHLFVNFRCIENMCSIYFCHNHNSKIICM